MIGNASDQWTDYYDHANETQKAVEALLLEWPEIRASMESANPPTIGLLCPKDHSIVAVVIEMGQDLAPLLVATVDNKTATARAADPLAADRGHVPDEPLEPEDNFVWATRVRLNCPDCDYGPVALQSSLLKVCGLALRFGWPTIPLRF